MLIVLTIFLLLFIPLAMLVLYLVRPKFSIQGFLAVFGVLVGWVLVLLARSDIPKAIPSLQWEPGALFPASPEVLINDLSWFFSFALISLALAMIIISIAQLGRSTRLIPAHKTETVEEIQPQESNQPTRPAQSDITKKTRPITGWLAWAFILLLTSLGLVAVIAGNLLTVVLAWAALDFIELVLFLGHSQDSQTRFRAILAFSIKMASAAIVLLACLIQWSQGLSVSFGAISASISIYLFLAAGLRLCVHALLPGFPVLQASQPGLGIAVNLIPSASCFLLLAQVANKGFADINLTSLVIFTVFIGVLSATLWMLSKEKSAGISYWILATSALSMVAALLNHPTACISWSIASLFIGGLFYSLTVHRQIMLPIIVLGLFNLTALPFSPTWQVTSVYQVTDILRIAPFFAYMLWAILLLTHAFLLVGYLRFILGLTSHPTSAPPQHIERWVTFLYPIGLLFLIFPHLVIGWWLRPAMSDVTITSWVAGAISTAAAAIITYLSWRYSKAVASNDVSLVSSTTNPPVTFMWMAKLVKSIFETIAGLFNLFSAILEGEGGLLWALVLFALIFVFLQK